jgi:hypothetical protein
MAGPDDHDWNPPYILDSLFKIKRFNYSSGDGRDRLQSLNLRSLFEVEMNYTKVALGDSEGDEEWIMPAITNDPLCEP